MPLKNDKDRCECIQAFLATVAHGRLAPLWTADGPTPLACNYIDKDSPLSHGEHILLQVAFDIWNGKGKATVDDLLSVLDDSNLAAVLDVILIVRPGAEHHMVD
jgi:hypothetical protein